ncbi:MAG TPA: acetate--CoA ligase family protein [Methylomirabilota bacterium]
MTAPGAAAAGREPASLGRLFAPRSIALVGVPGDLSRPGARPFHFLRRHGYPGRIYPVNPSHQTIGDLPAYPSVDALPEPPDVAWIGLPAAQAAGALAACGRARVPFAVILGAGFAETGESGAGEQARLVESARRVGVRLLGPNTVGFVNGWDRVALTFSTVGKLEALVPGPVALLSQSGGLGGCLLDRAAARGIGVGLFVSTGNEADLSLADYLEWLVDDGRARAIACLVEQVREPGRVAAAVERAAARGIAIVALKLGASAVGSRAARSHTGSLAGGRDAWRAWAHAVGLLEVTELDHLVETAAHLAREPALGGPRMAMVTSSGGVAVALADALEPRGFAFAPLADETARRVGGLLPPYVTVTNPLDITAGLPDETFGEVLAAVARDPGIDVVLVPLTLATAGGGAVRAQHVIKAARGAAKPVVVCWPGGRLVRKGLRALDDAGVPLFATVSSCAAALGAALAFRSVRARPPRRAPAVSPVEAPESAGPVPWASVRALLVAAGLPVAPEVIVRDADEARAAAPGLRYPVAVKALGPLHRTEVGGVRLGVSTPEELLAAVRALRPLGEACLVQPMVDGLEVLVGAVRDAELGPFVMVAPGGVHAELYGERAMAPAPCDEGIAEGLIRECRALHALLEGFRGGLSRDRAGLVDTVTRAAALAAGLGPRLAALDLNPVIVGSAGGGATIVDARIVLDP